MKSIASVIRNHSSSWFFLFAILISSFFISNASFAQTKTIEGTINLPQGEIADGNVEVFLDLLDGQSFAILDSDFLSIADGDSSVAYNLSYDESNLAGNQVLLLVQCFNNCASADGNNSTSFALQDDGSLDENFNTVASSSLTNPTNIQFPALPILNTFSGTISLPAGQVADGSIRVFMQLRDGVTGNLLDDAGGFIEDGDSSDAYSFTYIESDLGNEAIIEVICDSTNCAAVDGNSSTTFSLQDDGSLAEEFNTVPSSSLTSPTNLQFPTLPIATVSGAISLPAGQVAEGTMSIEVQLRSTSNGALLDFASLSITDGDSSIPYSLNYLESSLSGEAQVLVICESNCSSVDANSRLTFYLQNDGSLAQESNTVPLSSLTSPTNLQFPTLPIATLSGTISLPAGQVADNSLGGFVTLLDGISGNSLDDVFFIIEGGDSSTSYTLTYIESNLGEEAVMQVQCTSICLAVDFNTRTIFSLQDDGKLAQQPNTVPSSSLTSPTNLQFPTEPITGIGTVSGIISLPTGTVAIGDISVSVGVFDGVTGSFLDTTSVNIFSGDASAAYEIIVNKAANGARVQVLCFLNCTSVDNNSFTTFHLQDDGSLDERFNTVPVSLLTNPINLQFPSLTGSEPEPEPEPNPNRNAILTPFYLLLLSDDQE